MPVMFNVRFPNPVFVIEVMLPAFVKGPLITADVSGLGTEMLYAFGTVTDPFNVAVYAVVVAFSNDTAPWKTTGFTNVLLLFKTSMLPAPKVNEPVPTGPFQKRAGLFNPVPAATKVVTFVLEPNNTPPLVPVVVNPPVNVFAPVNCNNPFPAFVMDAAFDPKYVTSVADPIALFAFVPNVTVVPEIAVTVWPSNVDPTTKPAGTLVTVTVGLAKLLDVTFTVPAVFAPVITDPMFKLATNGA